MPVEWRLHVLEERLRQCGFDPDIQTADLYDLPPAEQSVVLDAIIATGEDFPVVLVAGVAACAGDIDIELIAATASGSSVRRAD